jgi:hypothetical protein
MRPLRLGLAALLTTFVTTQAMAVATIGNHYTTTLDTGLREFDAEFNAQVINTDGSVVGSTVSDTSGRFTVPAFQTSFGSLVGLNGLAAFVGYPFEATFAVQGATDTTGDQVIAHEVVAGTIEMDVNGVEVTSTPFSVTLNPNCTASNNGFTILDCSDEQKQTYFTAGAPVAIHAGDVVNFQYTLSETDISCEVIPVGGGKPEVCIQGNTGITDLHNINDPQWDGAVAITYDYIPEPASMSMLGLGLAGLIAARRRRRLG